MRNRPSISFASLAGWFATAAAVAAIPVLLISEKDRSPYFWHRVAWAEFLTLVVWGYFSGFIWSVFPVGRKRAGTGGLLPATGLVIGVYAVLSLALTILSDWPNRFHWAGQVVLLVLVILLFVFFEYAQAGAVAGAEPIPTGVTTPQELSASLRLEEDRIWSLVSRFNLTGEPRRLHGSLKALREAIQYSIQYVGALVQRQEYRSLADQIATLCGQVQGVVHEQSDAATAGRLADAADQLRRQVEQLAALLTRQHG